jgi:hypothetical protein
MSELFPILGGALVGLLVGRLRPALRKSIAIPLVIGLGITATVVSGEFRIGWEYLLIDIPLVGLSAVIALSWQRRRWRSRSQPRSQSKPPTADA